VPKTVANGAEIVGAYPESHFVPQVIEGLTGETTKDTKATKGRAMRDEQ
jgi:hypothetical protein